MKKVLIVLNDAILMSVFKSWVFRAQKKEQLFFAKDGKEAIEIIKVQAIDLLITELSLPEIDGLELACSIALYYPAVKMAFFLSTTSLASSEKLKKLTSLYFINKPNSLREFVHLTSVIEVVVCQATSLTVMHLAHFLELIEYQKKTCLLAVDKTDTAEKGLIYFEHGILYDAVYANLKAEEAVIEMLNWEQVKVAFKTLAKKQFRRQVQSSLSGLIKEQENSKAYKKMAMAVALDTEVAAQTKIEQPPVLPERLAELSTEEELATQISFDLQQVTMESLAAQAEQAKREAQAQVEAERVEQAKREAQAQAEAEKAEQEKREAQARVDAERAEQAKIQAEIERAKREAQAQAEAERVEQAKLQAEIERAKREVQAEVEREKRQLSIWLTKFNAVNLDNVLTPLQEIDDYLACAIFDMTGRLLIKNNRPESAHNLEAISVNAVIMIKTAVETVCNAGLGTFNFIQVTADEGIFEAVWVVEGFFVAAVLLKPEAKNTGLAKIHLIKVANVIRSKLYPA